MGTGRRFHYQLYTFNLKYNTRSRKHRYLSNSADKGTQESMSCVPFYDVMSCVPFYDVNDGDAAGNAGFGNVVAESVELNLPWRLK